MSESPQQLIERIIERVETIGDLSDVAGKSLAGQAMDLAVAIIEADRRTAYLRGKFDLLNEIHQLGEKLRDNCAYGRPTQHEATWLAVHEVRKPFDEMAIAQLRQKAGA